MPGPPPNPNARRRNDRDAWRVLPATCTRRAPQWPLAAKPKGLTALWRYLWQLPVAAIWHEQDAARLVARYALLTLAFEGAFTFTGEGERPDTSKVAAELRQIEDRLLISPSTRIRARVVIDEAAQDTAQAPGVADIGAARRARLAGNG